jgi:hypothetical protein
MTRASLRVTLRVWMLLAAVSSMSVPRTAGQACHRRACSSSRYVVLNKLRARRVATVALGHFLVLRHNVILKIAFASLRCMLIDSFNITSRDDLLLLSADQRQGDLRCTMGRVVGQGFDVHRDVQMIL